MCSATRPSSCASRCGRSRSSRPDHPYALLGADAVVEALEWFEGCVAAGPLPGYAYTGGPERNVLLPTAVGALRPSALVPETAAGGDVEQLKRVCIVGTPALRDLHPSLCAANLRQAGIEARARAARAEARARRHERARDRAASSTIPPGGRSSVPSWRSRCGPRSTSALPAMLGLRDPHGVWSDVEHRLGRRVFEIPTLPPSVPGMRLFEILRSALRAAGGRLVLGAEVVGAARDGERITTVYARAAGRDVGYRADWIVLAAGGFTSGAIELDSRWVTHERVLGLQLHGRARGRRAAIRGLLLRRAADRPRRGRGRP